MRKITLMTIAIATFIFAACKKEEPPKDPLVIPATYVSDNYDANTVEERALRAKLTALTAYMKKGDNPANTLSLDSLKHYFQTGTPSLKSITIPYYANLIENTFFVNLANNSGKEFDVETASTATVGGVYANGVSGATRRLLDSKGKETLQEVEKALFFSGLYNHLVALTKGTMTAATVDKMICIYGAHPSFPNSNSADDSPNPDVFIANYIERRDRPTDPTGLYRDIRDQFIKLKAAIEAGSKYNQEKNEAIAEIKLTMEKGMMATVINYLNNTNNLLSSDVLTTANAVAALHNLSECIGFVHGFKGLSQSDRKITDAQITYILEKLNAPAGTAGTLYEFVTSPSTEKANLTDLRTYIKNIYGFTEEQMTLFNVSF